MSIFYINPLDGRHGSTYRARNLLKAIWKLQPKTLYLEGIERPALFENEQQLSAAVTSQRQLVNVGVFDIYQYLQLIKKMITKKNPKLIWLQKFLPTSWTIINYAAKQRIPVVVDWDDVDSLLQKNIVKRGLVAACEKYLPRRVRLITTHSQEICQLAEKRGAKNIALLKQTIDSKLFSSVSNDSEEIFIPRNSRGKTFAIMCTLNEGGARDLGSIIAEARRLVKIDPQAYFLIVGGGEYQGKIEQMVEAFKLSNNFKITGLLPQDKVASILTKADYGLVYMRDDLANRARVSLKTIEYLACNLPVIGKLVGESAKMFSQMLAQQCSNQEQLFSAMSRALNGQITKQNFREKIIREYDWRVNIEPIRKQLSLI